MKTYTFNKEGRDWYIDLPEFIEQGGSKGDLQMVEGADTMLEIMSNSGSSVVLTIDRTPFNGADVLDLVERCDPYVGGGYYKLHKFEEKVFDKTMWLCGVTEFVFGDLPQKIFVKRETNSIS